MSDKENKCIRIGRMYVLLSALLEYKHDRADATTGLRDVKWDSRGARRVAQALVWVIALQILTFGGWISGILANRKLLRICAQLDFDRVEPDLPAEKTLETLWNEHGPSIERLHGCSLDDRMTACACGSTCCTGKEQPPSSVYVRESKNRYMQKVRWQEMPAVAFIFAFAIRLLS